MLSLLEASHPADKQFKTPVPSLSRRGATEPGWGCSISEQGEPKAAASGFASLWCPQFAAGGGRRAGVQGRGTESSKRGSVWSRGSRANTAAFQTRQMIAPGEQHLQTNPGWLYRAGLGLSPPSCLELRNLGMMEPGRDGLICWKEQPGA